MRIKIYILYLFYIIIFIDLHHFRKVYKYPRIVNFMHFVNTMIEWKRSVFLGRVAERRDNKFYKFTTVIHPLNKIPIESIEHRTISKKKKKKFTTDTIQCPIQYPFFPDRQEIPFQKLTRYTVSRLPN